jgi:CRP-like cAMP-binding protein
MLNNMMTEEVPSEELEKFGHFMKVFKKGEKLISEGDNDNILYLLRKGTVGVYRNMGGADTTETLITFIGAVNFVGEMEIIAGGSRISTVRAYSDEVLVYAFENPDYATMLCNKEWGLKLLLRLSSDLKLFSDRAVELEREIALLRQKMRDLQEQSQ